MVRDMVDQMTVTHQMSGLERRRSKKLRSLDNDLDLDLIESIDEEKEEKVD